MTPLLRDTAAALWPGATVRISHDPSPPAGARDYVVLPHVRAPRWVLPAREPVTAGAVAGQESGPMRRTAVAVLAGAHRRGLTHRLPLPRLRVEGGASLPDALAELVGSDCTAAIRLGAWRHSRSLVARLFDPNGATVAFGKAGIDDHGRASVAAEYAGLEFAGGLGLTRVVHPTVLHRCRWHDLELLLVSPLAPPDRAAPARGMPIDAMLELARAGTGRTAPIATSEWAAAAAARLAEITDAGHRAALDGAFRRITAAGAELPIPLGPWHGDWTPWNMARDGDRVLLWDWEHHADDVPVGFDLVHHLAQQLRVASGTDRTVEDTWLARAAGVLAGPVGLTGRQGDLVLAAYLLEVNLRFVLDRQGTPDALQRRDGWGLAMLERVGATLAP